MGKITLTAKHSRLNYQSIILLVCSLFLVLMLAVSSKAIFANDEEMMSEGIMTVDIPYNLFMALVLYHELSETEQSNAAAKQQDRKINQEIILAIQDVLTELQHEGTKYQLLLEQYPKRTQIQQLLSRIDHTQAVFNKELLFRQKVAEFLELQQKQQQIMGDQPR